MRILFLFLLGVGGCSIIDAQFDSANLKSFGQRNDFGAFVYFEIPQYPKQPVMKIKNFNNDELERYLIKKQDFDYLNINREFNQD